MTWKYVVCRAAPLLLIILLVSYFSGDGWHAFPSALVAWGTILLAFATFMLIRNTNELEKARRAEIRWGQERQYRDGLLSRIIEWAVDVMSCDREIKLTYFDETINVQEMELDNLRGVLREYRSVNLESEYIKVIASVFKEDPPLNSAVEKVADSLQQVIDFLKNCLNSRGIDEQMFLQWKIAVNRYARDLVEEATKIKTRDIS